MIRAEKLTCAVFAPFDTKIRTLQRPALFQGTLSASVSAWDMIREIGNLMCRAVEIPTVVHAATALLH